MGQSITVTLKIHRSDMRPFDEYIKLNRRLGLWVSYIDDNGDHQNITRDALYRLDAVEADKILKSNDKISYEQAFAGSQYVNGTDKESCPAYGDQLIDKINAINDIICRFRYNDSNPMVDYFDTNFYYDISIVGIE